VIRSFAFFSRIASPVAFLLLAPGASSIFAQEDTVRVAPIVVTPTRVEQSAFDLPTAVNVVDIETIQEQRAASNIAETLARVPGTVVQNRESASQEQQIIIRGFGARAGFGIRGIKLLADGIPASTPDGQGGTGLFDLSSAKRIEVLRGPFSALYGNHSGGVVQVVTEDGPERPTLSGIMQAGSYGTRKFGLKFGGQSGDFNYIGSASRLETDGFRDHSSSTKKQFNAKLSTAIAERTHLHLVMNYLDQPNDEDPLGLTAAEVAQNPRQAFVDAYTFNTRRSLNNKQTGLVVESAISDSDTLRGIVYLGTRENVGYLAIALVPTQNNIRAAGGVSAFDRDFWGTGLRWTRKTSLADRPFTLSVGAEYDKAVDDRKGYLNVNGVQGALKRDEENLVDSHGEYVQAEWKVADQWLVSAGLRYTKVNFESKDRFICTTTVNTTGTPLGTCSGTTTLPSATAFNPNDSGDVSHDAWTPVAGVVYQLSPTSNLYANVGKSFETPTLIELAYRTDGSSGMNFALKPSTSRHYEVGLKTFVMNDQILAEIAAFHIDTDDEIVVFSNAGGRQTFQNSGKTKRQGMEVSASGNLGAGLSMFFSATYLEATFEDSFTTCTGINNCSVPTNVVPSGNRIPGVPRYTTFGEFVWRHPASGFLGGVEMRWHGDVATDDLNSAFADKYFVAGLRAGFEQKMEAWKFSEFARVDNVLDKEYIGAVLVNAANNRFYAPGAGRNYLVGLTASHAF
jgi:iron complex outermembrane recepter protein